MNWQDEYKRKLMTAEEAVKSIKSGDRVHIPLTEPPELLINTLAMRKDEVKGVLIDICAPLAPMPWFNPGYEDSFPVTIWNYAAIARPALQERRLDYVPMAISTVSHVFDSERRPGETKPIDHLLVKVTAPNERGYCTFGHSLWYKQTCVKHSKRIIAEVDDTMARCFGDTFIHVSQIDAFVENTLKLPTAEEVEATISAMEPERQAKVRPIIDQIGPRMQTKILPLAALLPLELVDMLPSYLALIPPGEVEKAIAGYLSTMIQDRDCIQTGVGTPSAYMAELGAYDHAHDLGYHSEMAARGIARLVDGGVITGKYKNFHQGKAIASTWDGCDEDETMNIIHNNPKFELHDSSYVFNTYHRNENMTATNNIISIDLSGQINSETVYGTLIVNGPGGQPESHIGALRAPGGRAISLMRSTAVEGTVSNVVPTFEPGTTVTIPRYWADYVISEYGIAKLMGKSLRERAGELTAIAHPDFRAELKKEAQKLFYP